MASEACHFLQSLFAGKPDELYILLWRLPEKRSQWFRELQDAIDFVESRHEHDLYVGVGLSRKDYGATHRCLSDEVAGIVGLWADIDVNSDAHAKGVLPRTAEDALEVLPKQLPPTFLIRTGNGIHAWWLFREPLIFETDEQRGDAASFAKRWQSLFRLRAASRGWAFDCLSDLARLLRIPGTQNCKDPQNPKPVEIHSQSDRRYNPSELAEFLDDHGIPDPDEQERVSQNWKEKFANKPLSIDPGAIAPEDLLNRHMGADPRFRSTWLRERKDLKDDSQSGYDLALANFGFDAGFSEQQIVDLIIHHRRIHGQRPRTRIDYFQRTIAKAFESKNGGRSPSNTPADLQKAADRQPQEQDSPTARAILCEQISSVLGVRILRILKISGKEPIFQMELDTAKVEFSDISKLIEQRSLRFAIASAANHLIPRLQPKLWEQLVQTMLAALTVEDGGEETDFVGSARIHIDNYLSETPFIEPEMDQPIQARRKPAVINGQIAICSGDLQAYINKTASENYPVKAIVSMLTAIGASSMRVKVTPLRDQTRWLLPLSEFDPRDYTAAVEEKSDA